MEGLDGHLLPASASSSLLGNFPGTRSGQKREREATEDVRRMGETAPVVAPPMTHPMLGVENDAFSATNNNEKEVKKAKLDEFGSDVCADVGRVVHVRNVGNHVPRSDVLQLGLPFGKVTNVLMLKTKNQGFLEFADSASALAMVNFYSGKNRVQPMLGGRTVFVQFSQHKELRTTSMANEFDDSTAVASGATRDAVEFGSGTGESHRDGKGQGTSKEPSPVLRIMIENMIYPITLDTLLVIFRKYGSVMKIITFTKNNTFQSLLQYDTAKSAEGAKTALNGQNIYNGCCTLRVDFSRMTQLHVKYNNDKSRDFTNPNLSSGTENLTPSQRSLISGAPGILAPTPFAAGIVSTPGANFGANDSSTHASPLLASALQSIAGLGGSISQGLQNALLASLGGTSGGAAFHAAGPSRMQPGNPSNFTGLVGSAPAGGVGSVLLVSNLNESEATPDGLFILFGVYADVLRVKILYNKKDNALIQVADAQQAALAMTHLDKIKVWGKSIRVAASKHAQVQMPKEGAPDGGLTKDYSNSTLHRFKKKGSKNYSNIFAPSQTLHLSNIPANTTEEELVEAFSKCGKVRGFKFFPKDRKMALIGLDSVEEAVCGLIYMHNYQLAENSHLRVSFSKSSIQS